MLASGYGAGEGARGEAKFRVVHKGAGCGASLDCPSCSWASAKQMASRAYGGTNRLVTKLQLVRWG